MKLIVSLLITSIIFAFSSQEATSGPMGAHKLLECYYHDEYMGSGGIPTADLYNGNPQDNINERCKILYPHENENKSSTASHDDHGHIISFPQSIDPALEHCYANSRQEDFNEPNF